MGDVTGDVMDTRQRSDRSRRSSWWYTVMSGPSARVVARLSGTVSHPRCGRERGTAGSEVSDSKKTPGEIQKVLFVVCSVSRGFRARCGVRAVREEVHAPRIGVFLIHLVRVRVLVVMVPLRRPRDGRVARRALPRQDVTSRVVRAHQSGFDGVSVLLERPRLGGGRRILMDVEHRRGRLLARLGDAGNGVVAARARARVLRLRQAQRDVFENSQFVLKNRKSRETSNVGNRSNNPPSRDARSDLHLPCPRLSLLSPSG